MRLATSLRAAPLALILLTACHHHHKAAELAWVRLAAVPGSPAAAYLTLHGGKEGRRLVSVDSAEAGSSELHQSMTGDQNMATMKKLDHVDVPAHGELKFAPGGYHVMLFGVAPDVKAGDVMPLTAHFAEGDPVPVPARVVAAGDPAPY